MKFNRFCISIGLLLIGTLIVFNVQASTSAESAKNKVVITEGVGKDIPSAAQNAAKNALTQVVGSFIDTNTLLEKQVEIREGVKTQVKNLKTDIKEYSQGSIRKFEVLNVQQENGLYTVTAKAEILVDEFTAYIKGIVGGEREIAGSGLFAQAATKSKQAENKIAILMENVIEPLILETPISFDIGPPTPYESNENYAKSPTVPEMVSVYGSENIFSFEVTAKVEESYLINAIKSLEAISRNSEKIFTLIKLKDDTYFSDNPKLKAKVNEEDFYIIMHDGNSTDLVSAWNKSNSAPWFHNLKTFPFAVYVVGDSKSRIKSSGSLGASFFEYPGLSKLKKTLMVEFTDKSGTVLQQSPVVTPPEYDVTPRQAIAIASDYTSAMGLGNAWDMYGSNMDRSSSRPYWYGIMLVKERKFILLVAIDQDKLAQIEKIKLYFAD